MENRFQIIIDYQEYKRKYFYLDNLSRKDAQVINVDDKFLQELIEIWAEVNFQGKLRSLKEFEEQTLWHNSLICIENKPAFYNQWFNKDIYKVS